MPETEPEDGNMVQDEACTSSQNHGKPEVIPGVMTF